MPFSLESLAHVLALTEAHGGATVHAERGNLAGQDRYAVSIFPDRSRVIEGSATLRDLAEFVQANADLLARPDVSLGTWKHGGRTWIDAVATVESRERAVSLGRQFDQIAVFDLGNLVEIPTGGTGVVKPDALPLADRLEALAAA
ncbi:MAG TPA: hypothetical protein VF212_17600 [Longimicrobiales bacterium]